MSDQSENNTNTQSKQIPSPAVGAFNAFLGNFVQGKSYVLNPEKDNLFTKNNLAKTYDEYCEKSPEKVSFNDVVNEIKEKDGVNRDTMIDIINHAVWLWALPNNRKTNWVSLDGVGNKNNKKNRKEANNTTDNSKNSTKYKDELLKIQGVAGGGSGYVQTKTNGVRFLLYLFTKLVEKRVNDFDDKTDDEKKCVLKEAIIEECKNEEYNSYRVPDGVKNLLLHLCDSKKYEPIASSADKEKIVKAFWQYLPDNEKPDNEKKALEEKDSAIQQIKKYLINYQKETCNDPNSFSFYTNSLPLMWKGESATDLSLLQKLEYKKAMILYGPPGTGKTYTAMELAKEMIVRHFMKQYKEANRLADKNKKDQEKKEAAKKALKECFEILRNIGEEKKKYISYLQFHINYNYEDFIAGQVINGNSIETKQGFIFDVINKAQKHPGIPYVVILDEINRTDISRVFGELFTAIEKRGEDVTLTLPKSPEEEKAEVGKEATGKQTEESNTLSNEDKSRADKQEEKKRLVLNLPENIYFIGTMNEIDFSLERVDFALRRRFIWELLDYSEDSLEDIIDDRLQKYVTDEKLGDEQVKDFYKNVNIDSYCVACTSLNKKVSELIDDTYHIGHAFFAEIADIYIELRKNNTTGNAWDQAKKILWEISIKPTLEAYCGTMDRTEKEKYLKGQGGKFYEAFFGKENPEDD